MIDKQKTKNRLAHAVLIGDFGGGGWANEPPYGGGYVTLEIAISRAIAHAMLLERRKWKRKMANLRHRAKAGA